MSSRGDDVIGRATLCWFRESAAQGIFTSDLELHIRSWNRWLVNATGIPEDAALGRHLLEVLPTFRERGFDRCYDEAKAGVVTVFSQSLHRFMDAGFRAHLDKPVTPIALAAGIARVAAGTN